MRKRSIFIFSVLLLIMAILFTACAPQAEEPVVEATEAEAQSPTDEVASEEAPTEAAPVEETSEDEPPNADNTLVLNFVVDKDTFDPHKTDNSGGTEEFGATLITKDPATGEYVPYLATDWSFSEDGTILTFHLREDVKFHNGTPLTAEDFAWTFTRALDPATASPAAGTLLGGVTEAIAVDDYTLQLTLGSPNFWILESLSLAGFVNRLVEGKWFHPFLDFGLAKIVIFRWEVTE